MSERVAGFVVALETDISEDAAERLCSALRCLHGVIDVRPLEGDTQSLVGMMRSDARWRDRLLKLVQEGLRDA